MCIDAEGNVLVADRSNNRIQMFTASGTWLTQWGSSGSGDGQFNAPIDVSSAPNGVVYVVETGGNRVQSFEPRDPSTSLGLIVSGDARLESNENFALSFGAPAASVAPAAPATITLTNDDVGVFSTSGASTSLVGSAMVSPIADGLRLSNLGLAGADGAEVTAGGLKLSSTQPGSIGFAADFASAATIPAGGANVVARMVGTVAGVPQATMGTYTVNLLPTGANSVGVDFSGVGASQWNVAVYNGATLVHQRTGHSGVGVGYQSCGPEPGMHASATGDPIPGVDVEIEQVPGGIAVTSRPGGCTHIDLGDGTGVHAGDRIVFRSPSPALRSGDGLAAVRFTSSLSSLDVKSLGLRVLGALHRSSGNALFAANYNSAKSNTGCIMKNIGPTGGDGVRIAVPEGKKAVHTEFGNTAFQSSDAGASLTARAVGTANGTPNTTLFTLSQTATSTGTQLRANFTGASVESVVVLNAGAVAYRGEVANNVVVGEEGFQSPALGAHEANGPARVEAAGDPIPGVDIEIEQVPGGISAGRSTVLNYRNPRTFNIGGVLYSGNVISFKRAFSRGLHAQVVDDSTATLDEVQWIATNPGATTLDSLEIVAETIGAGGTGTTGVGDSPARVLSALRAWPNPSGGRTGVAFTLGSASRVRVVIYDVAGREVREWHARRFEAGEHHVEWDGLDAGDHPVAAGIYFARVEAGGMRHELKLVRLH
ncbi:MAG: T9SS type A sorting domain-containing protein [Candidatus Eisenbacteria bacterium]|uniref:T9SS type A sorting domain-containing protein n=1 Tax=Eiseniibacteriota bacterium TaxID=2212470 RepID=A0A933SB05_UNCEI|nr:T9SS type A sorting domain-containing protein [Candidatus Eisenbacteria bacterium]